MKIPFPRIFKFEKSFLGKLARVSVLLFSCILYVHGTSELLDFANNVEIAQNNRNDKELDAFKALSKLFNENDKVYALGASGVFARFGLQGFIGRVGDSPELLLAIKYVNSNIEELKKQVQALDNLNKELLDSKKNVVTADSDTSENACEIQAVLPLENFEITKIKSNIEQLLSVICTAHLILFIAFGDLLEKLRLGQVIFNRVISVIKSVVQNSLKNRQSSYSNSFYDTALAVLAEGKKEKADKFKQVFAKNFENDRKSGHYKFVLKLIEESMAFCGDVYNEPKLKAAFAKTVLSEDSIAKAFPGAVLETKGLLELV